MVPSAKQINTPFTRESVDNRAAPVTAKLVVVACVVVTMVNTPVEAPVAPIVVLSIEPPKIVTLFDVKFNAVKFVEDAVVANKFVEVACENTAFVTVALVPFKFVTKAFVEARLLVVALVTVAFVPLIFVTKKFTVAKLVEVAFVVVLFKIVAVPVTFKFVVTKFPVDVPPPNSIVDVATLP